MYYQKYLKYKKKYMDLLNEFQLGGTKIITATFKDKSDWSEEKLYEWSSQAINKPHVMSTVWNEDGSGKTVEIEIYPGRLYEIIILGKNIGFKREAFKDINEEKMNELLQNQLELLDIFIIGESNHEKVREKRNKLKKEYLDQGAYIFGEGLPTNSQQTDLDEILSGIRTDILFASLFTKSLEYLPNENHKKLSQTTLLKRGNMISNMLEYDKPPNLGPVKKEWEKIKNKSSDVTSSLRSLMPFIAYFQFDFLDIYEYYFGKDTYYTDMVILLSLSNEDAFKLNRLGAKDETYGKNYYNITQKAREMEMIKRVNDYMSKPDRRKVVIFTGLQHMNKLEKELSENFSVETSILAD